MRVYRTVHTAVRVVRRDRSEICPLTYVPALLFLRIRLTVEKSLSAKSAVSSTLISDTSTVALLNLEGKEPEKETL